MIFYHWDHWPKMHQPKLRVEQEDFQKLGRDQKIFFEERYIQDKRHVQKNEFLSPTLQIFYYLFNDFFHCDFL